MAGLSHPNVVAIHDIGEEAGVGYVVMEPLPGTTLADELGAGPLSETRVTEIGRQMLAALAAAHAAGIVHGDLQPANVITCANGAVKLADFGGPTPARSAPEPSRAGGPTGALVQLSPKPVDGQPASPAGDIYGAGAVLYECLVGRPPFGPGPTAALVAAIQGGGPVPVRALRPAVDPALAAVLERALDPHPDRRFDSAVAMSGALLSRLVYATSTHPLPAAGRTVVAAPRRAVPVLPRHPVAAEPARPGPTAPPRQPVPAEAARHVPAAPLLLPAASVGGPARPGGEEAARAVGGAPRTGARSPSPQRVLPKAMQRLEGHLVLLAALAGAIVIGGLVIAALVGTRPSTGLNSHSAVSRGTRPAGSAPAGKSAAPPTTQPSLGSGSVPLAPLSHRTVPSRPRTPLLRLTSASPRSGASNGHHVPARSHRAATRHRPLAHRHHRPPAHHHRRAVHNQLPSRRNGHRHPNRSEQHRRRHHPHHHLRHRYSFFSFYFLLRRLF